MGDIREKEQQTKSPDSGQRKDFIQKYIVKNLGIKSLSFVMAIIVWMAIVNIEDPYKERKFTVTVETINEDALASVNKVYEVIEGGTAQVRVKGKKSVVDRLRADDIRATADLSNLSAVNAVAIVPELKKNVSDEPALECDTVLKVSLEDRASKQVKVTVMTNGTPQEGYSIGECTATPNMLEVTGGESVINRIDSVRVTVNVNGVGEDFRKKVVPSAYDANGKEVSSSTLDYGITRVRVQIHVLKTKTIPVNINITGEPAAGYEFVDAECLPEEIQIVGSRKDLESINQVDVPIDITGMKSASGSVEQNISIQDYLPDGVTVLADYAQVSLRIGLEKMMSRTISVPISDIKFASLSSRLAAEIVGNQSTVKLVVQGLSSALDALEENGYTAYVDCEGLREGRHRLKVQLDLGDSSTVIRTDRVEVKITRAEGTEISDDNTSTEIRPETSLEPQEMPLGEERD